MKIGLWQVWSEYTNVDGTRGNITSMAVVLSRTYAVTNAVFGYEKNIIIFHHHIFVDVVFSC